MGTSGAALVFLHANGYPPECYLPLLSGLATNHKVWAIHQRPLWPGSRPEAVESWHALSDDLIRFMDDRDLQKVVAVGHSMGAVVALRAAIRAPERFTGLVLLDPVLVDRTTMVKWRLLRMLGVGHRLHSRIRGASRRRRSFGTLDEAFRGYRHRGVFKYMSDDALTATIAGLLAPNPGGGYELRYSPKWESRMYHAAIWNDGDLWDGLRRLSLPTLVVRGAESDTLAESTFRELRRANALIQIARIERASHLVPLEQPEAAHELIGRFLRDPGVISDRGFTASAGADRVTTLQAD